ncbi:aquaporin-like protein [Diplogelasinospora grovesii]|uniref:Aquaporin-like protein n=1 Tax=Diplogelasinospora grovesii TaxID=303347 RepID=A0AAN6N729_9PEZI|nr:aquaporin-like protein [Diplogelasinospora grovesii]
MGTGVAEETQPVIQETTNGVHPAISSDPTVTDTDVRPQYLWPKTRSLLQDAFSEFMGTFILVLLGDGSIAQVVLSKNTKGDWQSICWGWGLGLMFGAYTATKSGGHLNPAVTLSMCVFRGFSWRKFPIYMCAQILGAMAAALVVYGNYKSAIDQYEGYGIRTVGLNTSTAGIFATYPQPFMTRTGMFFSEFIGSSILMFLIFAVVDNAAQYLVPLCLFFVLFAVGACFGWETGFAVNLARDFGPRLVTYALGYGNGVWNAGPYYFWVPMVAPFFGCLFGGFLYDVFLYTGESPINKPFMGVTRPKEAWRNAAQKEKVSKA